MNFKKISGENGTDDDNILFRQYISWNKTSIESFILFK